MTHKEKVAKRSELFSLKAYLYKKAQKRVTKLQERQVARQQKADKVPQKTVDAPELVVEDTHEHGENCDHNH